MGSDEQFELLIQLLRKFEKAGVLDDFMLIGSWCLRFYRFHFENPGALPAFRTMDVDFLIPYPHSFHIKDFKFACLNRRSLHFIS